MRAVLEAALRGLDDAQRQVVELDRQGYSYREIAERTGLPVGTVRSRLSRARGRLRQLLAPELVVRLSVAPAGQAGRTGSQMSTTCMPSGCEAGSFR